MSALLGDPAVLQYQDAVRRAHCGQTVGDEETGAPLRSRSRAALICSSVSGSTSEVASSKITMSALEREARQGQQLPLALGEAGTAVSECGIISIRQGGEKGMDTGRLGGGLDLGARVAPGTP